MSQTISYQWERASNLAQGEVVKVGHRRESRESSISRKILGGGTGGKNDWEFQKYAYLIFVYIYRSCSVITRRQNILHVIIFNRELITDIFKCGQLWKAVLNRKSPIVRFKVPLNTNFVIHNLLIPLLHSQVDTFKDSTLCFTVLLKVFTTFIHVIMTPQEPSGSSHSRGMFSDHSVPEATTSNNHVFVFLLRILWNKHCCVNLRPYFVTGNLLSQTSRHLLALC